MMIIRKFFALFGILTMAVTGLARAEAPAHPPVVVELFTSQGCPNCPKANAFLADLAIHDNVIALSYAVDYWDYLGWQDTFAMPAFTERQYAYGKALKYPRVYTPQIIIDGRKIYMGVHQKKVRKAIDKANHSTNADADADADADAPVVHAHLNAQGKLVLDITGISTGKAAIWLAAYTPGTQTIKVKGGENKGKQLVQVNMVTGLTRLASWEGGPLHMELPMPSEGGCAILLQADGLGPILAAAKVEI